MIHSLEDFGGLSERRHRKEVRRNKELEGRGVIGRTERRGYEPARLYRISHTIAAFCVELPVGHTCEPVRAMPFLALLFTKSGENCLHAINPFVAEDRSVTGHLPILVREPNRIALRINLPFPLVVVRVHVRTVSHPMASCRAVVERIGVDSYRKELTIYDPGNHPPQMLILSSELHIRPDLGSGIAQPHGVYVSGIDEGVRIAVLVLAEMYRRVECVREAVAKHPRKFRVRQL